MKKRYARILAATLSAAMVFTSAPTAAFATELSVSEDAVEAEGYNASEVDALFPASVKVPYGASVGTIELLQADGTTPFGNIDTSSGIGSDLTGDGGNAIRTVTTDLSAAELATATPGTTVVVTVTYPIKDDTDSLAKFAGNTGYDATKKTISKSYTAKVEKAVVTGVPETPAGAKATYAKDEATAYDGGDSAIDAWKYVTGSVTAAVKATDVGATYIEKGAKFRYEDAKFDSTKYDTDKFIKDINADPATKAAHATYALENGFITVTVPVIEILQAAALEAADVVWPTAIPALTVGDKIADVKFDKASNGTFAITDVKIGGATAVAAGKINKSGEGAVVTVTFTNSGNYAGTVYTKDYIVNVGKKVIKASDAKVVLKKTEFPFGTTYKEVLAATNVQDSENYNSATLYGITAPADIDIMPSGQVTLKAKLDTNNTEIVYSNTNSKETVVDVVVTVKEPKLTVATDVRSKSLTSDANDQVNRPAITASLTADPNTIITQATLLDTETYQWYELDATGKEKAISGATAATLAANATLDVADLPAGGYFCRITPVNKATKDATIDLTTKASKAVFDANIKAIDTKPVVFTTTKTTIGGAGLAAGTLDYGNGTTYTATFKLADGYDKVSVSAKAVASNGTTTALKITSDDFAGATRTYTVVAEVPNTLIPDDYDVVITFTSSSNGKTDVATSSGSLKVNKATLAAAAIEATPGVANANAGTIVYGTKTSDVKITSTVKYGTFYVSKNNEEYLDCDDTNLNVTFKANADTLKYYDTTAVENVDFTCPIKVKEKEITVKAKDVELILGQTLPKVDTLTFVPSGAVAGDDFADILKFEVKTTYGTALEEALLKDSIKKEGTYKGAVKTEFHVNGTRQATATSTATTAYDAGNYLVKVENADVIVKPVEEEKPTTPPTVAPTPAPVKQAVAAAPKAAKAKVSVKAGKKYTLKLKYAAGKKATVKKVTWKSSKKSVATVSSKGKVTAVKAGKATIAATITFKDGSKKKVKFTVTVK